MSISTVTKRIEEIAEDIDTQLLPRINTSPWNALLVDDSTDIDNKAMLCALYILCAISLPGGFVMCTIFANQYHGNINVLGAG